MNCEIEKRLGVSAIGGYLDDNEFPLQRLSIWIFLPKAQVDGVIRRSPLIFFEVHQVYRGFRMI